MLLAVLFLAFLALQTCAARDDEISFEGGGDREEIDFEPDKVLVRGVQQGLDAHLYWAVSLSTENAQGVREECATVLVDAETGETQQQPC